ncbi:MAG: hypothetical protein ACE5GV_11195 [Candidatus Scalindua sp.]
MKRDTIGLNINRSGMLFMILILCRLLELFKMEFDVNLSASYFLVKVKRIGARQCILTIKILILQFEGDIFG